MATKNHGVTARQHQADDGQWRWLVTDKDERVIAGSFDTFIGKAQCTTNMHRVCEALRNVEL